MGDNKVLKEEVVKKAFLLLMCGLLLSFVVQTVSAVTVTPAGVLQTVISTSAGDPSSSLSLWTSPEQVTIETVTAVLFKTSLGIDTGQVLNTGQSTTLVTLETIKPTVIVEPLNLKIAWQHYLNPAGTYKLVAASYKEVRSLSGSNLVGSLTYMTT